MFVGRKQELTKLNEMYKSNGFEFGVFYGRRRVGKTTLINEFCKNKKVIYFVGVESTEKENLQNFSKAVFDVTMTNLEMPTFDNFNKLFEYIYNIAKVERIILVIDEYPYLAQSTPSVSSILQSHIDKNLRDSKLFLILCGSSMSFMEYQVLGYKSPLYGRRTAQFKIRPFTYFESSEMLYNFFDEDKAVLYGVTGGIPEYLSRINNAISLRDNIVELFLNPAGRLFEEPSNLLKQELRDPFTYNAIITAIAGGASKLNEISTKVGLETSACSNHLTSLIALGLVNKEIPITESLSRKTIYLLEDQMFRFWYRFVLPNMNSIVSGNGDKIYDKKIEPQLNNYMGLIFEQICKQFLTEQMRCDKLPFFIGNIGRWWGNNPKLKRQEEIDILTFHDDDALFGECKWTNALVDLSVLNDLIEQSKLFHFKNNHFYLFAKIGFTDQCINAAHENDNVRLIAFNEINR